MAAATHLCSFQRRASLNESEDKERYLCISDGFVIFCLDLKKGKGNCSETLPLPKISPLKLLEEGLPVSMGLFKLGPDAYMVGGQEFPDLEKPSNLKLPDELYEHYDCKGSSCKTFHLCVAAGRLSLFECDNIPPLKKPKHWPVVEKIGNRVHVIETIPHFIPRPKTIPSHEVLNLNDLVPSWTKLPPMHHPHYEEFGMFICDHLVVGDRIYARAISNQGEHLVFESKTDEWKVDARGGNSTMHVLDLLCGGKLICVGEYPKRESEGDLYMVIEVKDDYEVPGDIQTEKIFAEAHLVNAKGDVMFSQDLPQFFGWLKEPASIREATMFCVNEHGNTVCAVVLIKVRKTREDLLFITTFTVEAILDAVKQPPYIDQSDFVKVVPKYREVYLVNAEVEMRGWTVRSPARLSACFLPSV